MTALDHVRDIFSIASGVNFKYERDAHDRAALLAMIEEQRDARQADEVWAKAEEVTLFRAALRCDSPIEDRLLFALRYLPQRCVETVDISLDPYTKAEREIRGPRIVIFQQAQCGPYRADFLVLARPENKPAFLIDIEADGQEFHKGQEKHDRARDAYFTRFGAKVFRFKGSSIMRDPLDCASKVGLFIQGRWFA